MPFEITPVKRPDWTPVPYEGVRNVKYKSLLRLDHIGIAMLKFEPYGTINEHPADFPIDVIVIAGEGMTSIEGESAPIKTGEKVRWPARLKHQLWTGDNEMITLMVEHYLLK